jgi:hypothetical protein
LSMTASRNSPANRKSKPETRNQKPETRNPDASTTSPDPHALTELEARDSKSGPRNPQLETLIATPKAGGSSRRILIPQTPNPKPQTPNTKHQTPNPKPQTPNPKPQPQNPEWQGAGGVSAVRILPPGRHRRETRPAPMIFFGKRALM